MNRPDERAALRLGLLDLYDALAAPGCPVCRSVRIREERYFRFLLNEYVSDASTRNEVVRSGGFCARHTWLMTTIERERTIMPVGAALLLEVILRERMRSMQSPSGGESHRDACPACTVVSFGTSGELRELAEAVAVDGSVRDRYGHSDGLCVAHVDALVAVVGDTPGARLIVAHTVAAAAEVMRDLREADRKRDWKARDEPRGVEQTAWQRAALLLGGALDELSAAARDEPWPAKSENAHAEGNGPKGTV